MKVYTEAIKTFLLFYNDKPAGQILESDVVRFNNEHILKNRLSSSYQNQIVNAIKLFFGTMEKKSWTRPWCTAPNGRKPCPMC